MTDAQNLLKLTENLKNARLLVLGDVMLDSFVYGDVDRISPEAPVPVLRVARRVIGPGGAGNVAANLAGLGCAVSLVSVTGADDTARILEESLKTLPGISLHLVRDSARPTISKERYVAGAQHMLRVDAESAAPLSEAIEDAVIAALKSAAASCDALILSDYGKGLATPRVIRAAIELGKPVYVDPKGRDYARYRGAALVTPNRKELGEATNGHPTANDADITAAARLLMQDCGVAAVLATRSADGMSVVQQGVEPAHLRTHAREVYDVSGAGDTVMAVTAAALCAGAGLVTAASLANIAAGIVVEKTGTAAITSAELARRVQTGGHIMPTIAPVLSWDDMRDTVAAWRGAGLTVGFTNGCFDIIHQGHVTMLAKCRAQCDRLVLGLNVDSSIKRLKGPTRPVNGQDARARVIAGLGSIDAVAMFGADAGEGDTPLNLIKAVRPDIIFKGADYTAATVVGAEFVATYGGRVVLVPLEEGFSTTATIQKLGSAA